MLFVFSSFADRTYRWACFLFHCRWLISVHFKLQWSWYALTLLTLFILFQRLYKCLQTLGFDIIGILSGDVVNICKVNCGFFMKNSLDIFCFSFDYMINLPQEFCDMHLYLSLFASNEAFNMNTLSLVGIFWLVCLDRWLTTPFPTTESGHTQIAQRRCFPMVLKMWQCYWNLE